MRTAQTQHHLIEALFNATDYGVLMTDPDGTDLLCNATFGAMVGIEPEKVSRLPQEEMRSFTLERVRDPVAFNAYMERVYADPNLELIDEFELVAPTACVLRRHTAPVRDDKGNLLGRIWTFLDVTETRRLQAESLLYEKRLEERLTQQARELQMAHCELLRSAQVQAVGTLAVGVAHDIRNIITSLRLELEADKTQDLRGAAAAQLDRLYTLTHSLLALAEAPTEMAESVNVCAVVDFAFTLVNGQANIDGVELVKNVPGEVPQIHGNPRRLEQLFVNLVLNGIHAVASTGGQVTVTICPDGNRVRVDISDNGPGIASGDLPHLYDPFFTTRANRAGMGLFSSRRIVEAHNGQIYIAGNPGQGACVSVWLPISAQAVSDELLETAS